MNENVIRQIARKSTRLARVGQSQPMAESKQGFFVFDPEWARLKRKYILKNNWYELYKESEQFAPEKVRQEVRQAYRSFKIWEKNFTTWSDVAFGEFPEQLYKQTVEYSKQRAKVLPYVHQQNRVSNTIPGEKMSRTPPRQLAELLPGIGNKAALIILALGAFWIWSRSREDKGSKVNNERS